MIITQNELDNKKSRIDLVLKVCIILDAIFIIITTFFWVKNKGETDYWKSLYTIHIIVYIIGFIEIAIKVLGLLSLK